MIIFLPLDQFGSKERMELTLSFKVILKQNTITYRFDVALKESCHYTEKRDYFCLLTEKF